MAVFRIKESKVTTDSKIPVETVPPAPAPAPADAAAVTLSVGTHRFQLVVVDDDNNRSDPTFVDVVVVKPRIIVTDETTIKGIKFGKIGGVVGPNIGPNIKIKPE